MTRAPPPSDDELARAASIRLSLRGRGHKLPPDLTAALHASTRASNMIERWLAVCDAVARGKSRSDGAAYEDAVEQLAGSPAACGSDMMKTDYDAVRRALRNRALLPLHFDADEFLRSSIASGAALAFWSDDGVG
jgi:hypothetical protein